MFKLRLAEVSELKAFVKMELQAHANKFVNSVGLESHKQDFKTPNIIYLSIDNSKKSYLATLY